MPIYRTDKQQHILNLKGYFLISLIFILTGIFISTIVNAQQKDVLFLHRNSNIIVLDESNNPLNLAWAGGLNSAQISHIDLNGNGIKDLFVFDKDGFKVSTFINLNKAQGNYKTYKYAPKYESMFPKFEYWCLLRDYNQDEKMDIFTSVTAGIGVYKNVTVPGKDLKFELVSPRLDSKYSAYFTNLFVTGQDLPVIEDLDYDGDIDILTFGVYGTLLEYHRNMSFERYGNYDSLDFVLKNKCWGHFGENSTNNSISLFDTCQYNVSNPQIISNDTILRKSKQNKRHVGSSLVAIQMNNDSAMDLVIGDVTFSNVTYLQNDSNIGTPNKNTSMIAQDTNFPKNFSNTIPVDIDYFPGMFYLDVNNDDTKDFIASPNVMDFLGKTEAGDNYASVWLYKNVGSNAHPDFKIATKRFLQEEMIDVGSGASPALADINSDGLLDMIVANYVYHDSTGSQLAYFKNIGTKSTPKFKLMNLNFGKLKSFNLNTKTNKPALGISPTIADINNDSVLDMLVGDAEGKIHWFTIDSTGIQLVKANFDSIDVGYYASPQLVDLDGDGLLDLVIGNQRGHIYYYRNTGTPTSPQFTLVTNQLGNVDTAPYGGNRGFCNPYFYRLNDTLKLLCATRSGYLHYYTDIDSNLNDTFTRIDTTYLGIYGGEGISIAGGDFIRNDSIPDILIGQWQGGLTAWTGSLTDSLPKDNTGIMHLEKALYFKVYPNPANSVLNIQYNPKATNYRSVYLDIYTLLGKKVKSTLIGSESKVNIQNMTNGIYILFIRTKSNKILDRKKIVIQHP